MPPELVRFEGFRYVTAAAWEAAFDEVCAARERWGDERGLDVLLPPEIDGQCPFDGSGI